MSVARPGFVKLYNQSNCDVGYAQYGAMPHRGRGEAGGREYRCGPRPRWYTAAQNWTCLILLLFRCLRIAVVLTRAYVPVSTLFVSSLREQQANLDMGASEAFKKPYIDWKYEVGNS